MQAKTPKFMQDSSNFDEKWPKKEQTQDLKHQLRSRPMPYADEIKAQDLQGPRKCLKKRSRP